MQHVGDVLLVWYAIGSIGRWCVDGVVYYR